MPVLATTKQARPSSDASVLAMTKQPRPSSDACQSLPRPSRHDQAVMHASPCHDQAHKTDQSACTSQCSPLAHSRQHVCAACVHKPSRVDRPLRGLAIMCACSAHQPYAPHCHYRPSTLTAPSSQPSTLTTPSTLTAPSTLTSPSTLTTPSTLTAPSPQPSSQVHRIPPPPPSAPPHYKSVVLSGMAVACTDPQLV